MCKGPAGAVRFREVLAVGEYRAMWSGQALSAAGDQFCRVALTVLVYERTNSSLWTALTYAGTYLPWLLGGLVLGRLADRWPRRTLLVFCDLARGAVVTIMAAPGMPLPAMVALLYVVTVLDGPFRAARSATYADILPAGPFYSLGVAVTTATNTAAMVAGFAVGGVLVSGIGARLALVLDAATFVVSAALIRFGVRARAPSRMPGGVSPLAARMTAGLRLVFADRSLRSCMLFGWLAAFYTVPEALAVPYAAGLKGGPGAAGLVFAAGPLGTAAGMAVFGRLVSPARQARWMGPLAVLCCGSLALCFTGPGLAWLLVILSVSGSLGCYQVAANARFVEGLRPDQRGQAFGVAVAGLMAAQGVAYLAAGAAAGFASPATVIATSGIAGAIAAAALAAGWQPRPASLHGRPRRHARHERTAAVSQPER